ncbi:MAG: ankyrin repeat domain-containing protein [Dongiaceae bacterium]
MPELIEELWIAVKEQDFSALDRLANHPDISGVINESPPRVFAASSFLGHACFHGYTGVVRRLLKFPEIDVNLPGNYRYDPPLLMALLCGHEETAQLLLDDPRINIHQTNRDDLGPTKFLINGKIDKEKMALQKKGTSFGEDLAVEVGKSAYRGARKGVITAAFIGGTAVAGPFGGMVAGLAAWITLNLRPGNGR